MRAGVVVAVVVFLAGCPGPAGQPTETVTSAPVPEAERFPPGVGPAGVVDPAGLAGAHADVVRATSYTLVSNRTVTAPDGTTLSLLSVRVRLAADRTYLATVRTAGSAGPEVLGRPPAHAQFWSNGTTYVRAIERADGWAYNSFTPPNEFVASWRYWRSTAAFGGQAGHAVETLATLFESVPTELVGTETVDGTRLYRLRGDAARSAAFAKSGTGPVTNTSLSATVTEAGVVREFDLSYDRTIGGSPATVDWELRYENVGNTSAPRPAWFERAVGQASSLPTSTATSTP